MKNSSNDEELNTKDLLDKEDFIFQSFVVFCTPSSLVYKEIQGIRFTCVSRCNTIKVCVYRYFMGKLIGQFVLALRIFDSLLYIVQITCITIDQVVLGLLVVFVIVVRDDNEKNLYTITIVHVYSAAYYCFVIVILDKDQTNLSYKRFSTLFTRVSTMSNKGEE